jgi:hypothetical protein
MARTAFTAAGLQATLTSFQVIGNRKHCYSTGEHDVNKIATHPVLVLSPSATHSTYSENHLVRILALRQSPSRLEVFRKVLGFLQSGKNCLVDFLLI